MCTSAHVKNHSFWPLFPFRAKRGICFFPSVILDISNRGSRPLFVFSDVVAASNAAFFHPLGKGRARSIVIPSKARNLHFPFCHPRLDRGSRALFVFSDVVAPSNAARFMAPAGAAAPRSRIQYEGEDCLSEASSAAQTIGTGAKAPECPRPGAHGFGSFCRNKRTSAGPQPRKYRPVNAR